MKPDFVEEKVQCKFTDKGCDRTTLRISRTEKKVTSLYLSITSLPLPT